MRDLKKLHSYSIDEQEGMYPFERDFLLKIIEGENLKQADIPQQGWTKYAKELGMTEPTPYRDKFTVIEEAMPGQVLKPLTPSPASSTPRR